MGYELIIEPAAQDEIDEAVSWYETRLKGLESVFLEYLEGYFEILKSEKISFAIKGKALVSGTAIKEIPIRNYL